MRIAALIWVFIVIGLCLSPFELKAHLHTQGRLHQSYHLVAFFVAACLMAWPVRSWLGRAAMLVTAAALAPATEWLEHRVWGNRVEWHDIWTDLSGVVLALLAILISARSAMRQARSLQERPLVSVRDVAQSIPEHHR